MDPISIQSLLRHQDPLREVDLHKERLVLVETGERLHEAAETPDDSAANQQAAKQAPAPSGQGDRRESEAKEARTE